VGDGEDSLRARLLARLAIELSFSEERERRARVSEEAVEIARRVGDMSALGLALVARHWSLWGPQNVQERLQAANDLLGLAQSSGDERLAMQGHRWRMIDLLELGEIDAVDVEIDAYTQIALGRRRVADAVYVHMYRAMRFLLAGDFDRADEESREALRLGERVQDTNAGNATLLQAFALRRERGGLERIEGAIRHYAESYATIPGWYCVLSLLLAESGRKEEARETVDSFARDEFRRLPLDGIWLGAIAHLAETTAVLGDPTHAAALYELLEPYADRNIAIGWSASCMGSASRHLGLLAGVLGRHDDAVAHFEVALAMNERMRAHPLVARTQVEFARVLLQGDGRRRFGPDEERAAALLEAGAAEAERMGMKRLLALAEQLRAGAAISG